MENFDKPYKTIEELVDILINDHHLIVPNPDNAKKILRYIPYYDLINGYKDVFMTGADKFKPSITFNMLYTFYVFDKGFQNSLFQFSLLIESFFKNILADVISSHISVSEKEYLNPDKYFKSKNNRLHMVDFFKKLQDRKDKTTD